MSLELNIRKVIDASSNIHKAHTHARTRTHMHMHSRTHMHMHAHAHALTHTHTCTCTFTHTHAHAHTHMRTRTHTHACVHTHTHTHTHTRGHVTCILMKKSAQACVGLMVTAWQHSQHSMCTWACAGADCQTELIIISQSFNCTQSATLSKVECDL